MWFAIASQALSAINNYKQQKREAIAQGRQMQEQAKNAITTMNYAFQNYEQERRDAFDSAVANLERININARGLQGSVDNAVAEEMGDSKTGRLISRATHADALRAVLSEKDNYTRKSNEVDLNKEQQLISTKTYTAGLHPPKLPSKMSMLWNMASGVYGAYAKGQDVETFRKTHYGIYNTLQPSPPYKNFSTRNYLDGVYTFAGADTNNFGLTAYRRLGIERSYR